MARKELSHAHSKQKDITAQLSMEHFRAYADLISTYVHVTLAQNARTAGEIMAHQKILLAGPEHVLEKALKVYNGLFPETIRDELPYVMKIRQYVESPGMVSVLAAMNDRASYLAANPGRPPRAPRTLSEISL